MAMLSAEQINQFYPIAKVDIYPGGAMQVYRTALRQAPPIPDRERGNISTLSKSSLTRLAFTVSVCHTPLRSILTLTYLASPIDLRNAKKHLNKFLVSVARIYGQFSYIWFMEFTKNSMAHFHVLSTLDVDLVSRHTIAHLWVKAVSAQHWSYCSIRTRKEHTVKQAMLEVHRHPKCFERIRHPEGAKRYALKYCLKPYQKQVPEFIRLVGRFWGTSRDIKPEPETVGVDITEAELREKLGADHRLQKAEIIPKYIFG